MRWGVAGIEVLTAFPYFAAIAIIVGSSASGGIVVMCFVMGERAGPVLVPIGDWINSHWP